jgi:hypothetical protein
MRRNRSKIDIMAMSIVEEMYRFELDVIEPKFKISHTSYNRFIEAVERMVRERSQNCKYAEITVVKNVVERVQIMDKMYRVKKSPSI